MTTSNVTPVVLLVEDDMLVRMTTLDLLEEAGCVVLEAANAAEALTLFDAADVVDLLVSDIGLPDIGGLELYDTLRRACPGLPVLFITGYGAENLQIELAGQPLVSVLGKPFQMRELTRMVNTALEVASKTNVKAKSKVGPVSTDR